MGLEEACKISDLVRFRDLISPFILNVKDVDDFISKCGDAGKEDIATKVGQGLCDFVKNPQSILARDLDDRVEIGVLVIDFYLPLNFRDHLRLTRDESFPQGKSLPQGGPSAQDLLQVLSELLQSPLLFAGGIFYIEGVEGDAIAPGVNLGLQNVQAV